MPESSGKGGKIKRLRDWGRIGGGENLLRENGYKAYFSTKRGWGDNQAPPATFEKGGKNKGF